VAVGREFVNPALRWRGVTGNAGASDM
jgi:hypothetical protein